MSLTYLFALAEPNIQLNKTDFPDVQFISFQGFQAVCKMVDEAEFGENAIQENLQDTAWVTQVAQQHDKVNTHLFKQGSIIPFRLATLFNSIENLQLEIIKQERIYRRTIEFFKEKSEWGIKFYINEKTIPKLFKKDDEILALQSEIKKQGKGTAFMLQKKMDKLMQAKADSILIRLLDAAQVSLTKYCIGVTQLNVQSKKVTGKQEAMVRNLAFLVQDEEEKEWFEAIDVLKQSFTATYGIILEHSGPWPVYNFVKYQSPLETTPHRNSFL